MAASFPTSVKDFGADLINGDYTDAGQINDLRAEVVAIETSLVGGGSGLSVTTKGDLQGYSTAAARVPIGTNGQVLTADSAQDLGLKWETPESIPTYLAPRVSSAASASSLAADYTSYDQYCFTALAANLTINAPTNAADGQKIIYRIVDNGTSRTLTWNAIFRAVGVTVPASTTAGKTVYVGTIYNAGSVKWDVVAVAQVA